MILIAVISLGAIGAIGAVFYTPPPRSLKYTKILVSHKSRRYCLEPIAEVVDIPDAVVLLRLV